MKYRLDQHNDRILYRQTGDDPSRSDDMVATFFDAVDALAAMHALNGEPGTINSELTVPPLLVRCRFRTEPHPPDDECQDIYESPARCSAINPIEYVPWVKPGERCTREAGHQMPHTIPQHDPAGKLLVGAQWLWHDTGQCEETGLGGRCERGAGHGPPHRGGGTSWWPVDQHGEDLPSSIPLEAAIEKAKATSADFARAYAEAERRDRQLSAERRTDVFNHCWHRIDNGATCCCQCPKRFDEPADAPAEESVSVPPPVGTQRLTPTTAEWQSAFRSAFQAANRRANELGLLASVTVIREAFSVAWAAGVAEGRRLAAVEPVTVTLTGAADLDSPEVKQRLLEMIRDGRIALPPDVPPTRPCWQHEPHPRHKWMLSRRLQQCPGVELEERTEEPEEREEQWGLRYKLNGKQQEPGDGGHVFDSRAEAEQHITAWQKHYPQMTYTDIEYMRREAFTGPWRPAEPEEQIHD